MKKRILVILGCSLIITACKKDNSIPDPVNTNLIINFTHTVNSLELITESMIYTNDAGEDYSVKNLKYIISDITLHAENGDSVKLDSVHFVDIAKESTLSFTYNNVPNNHYTSFSFTMGLDSTINAVEYLAEDFFGHMEWPMMGGNYHYMKLEGDFNDSLSGYGTHTRPTMVGDYSFNHVKDDISIPVNDVLGDVSIGINMEINNWYQTPNQIEFSTYINPDGSPGIMGNMQKQMELQANGMADVFSVSVTQQ